MDPGGTLEGRSMGGAAHEHPGRTQGRSQPITRGTATPEATGFHGCFPLRHRDPLTRRQRWASGYTMGL